MKICRNFDAFLIVNCLIDKRNYFVDIVSRFREFRRRFAMWEDYFVSMTNVFNFRETTRLKLFNLWTKKKTKDFLRIQICFRNCRTSFIIDLLNKLVYLFFLWWKKTKTTFVLESKRWLMMIWFFDKFFFFVFVIFGFFISLSIFESYVFLDYHFLSLFFSFFTWSSSLLKIR